MTTYNFTEFDKIYDPASYESHQIEALNYLDLSLLCRGEDLEKKEKEGKRVFMKRLYDVYNPQSSETALLPCAIYELWGMRGVVLEFFDARAKLFVEICELRESTRLTLMSFMTFYVTDLSRITPTDIDRLRIKYDSAASFDFDFEVRVRRSHQLSSLETEELEEVRFRFLQFLNLLET